MTLAELGESFRDRLTRKAYWGAFVFVMGLWTCSVALWWRSGGHTRGALLQVLSGVLFYFVFIWVSPMLWLWDGRPGLRKARFRQYVLAFLASECMVIAILAFEEMLGRLWGGSPYGLMLYITNLCFQGPALFLVGLLLAHQEFLSAAWRTSRQQAEEATAHQLKGQLHPHALFNALNSLAGLILDDPYGAEAYVEAMSSFMQRLLQASKHRHWPLSEERRLVEDYLVMEGMRLGSRLMVKWAWDESMNSLPVSPLLVQPLVENAVKHGINPSGGGGVLQVQAFRDGTDLCLRVGNTGALLRPPAPEGGGLGIPNLRRRLDLAYGDEAAFDLASDAEGWTWASIRIALSRRLP